MTALSSKTLSVHFGIYLMLTVYSTKEVVMKGAIGFIGVVLLATGCASSLKTFDSEKKQSVGIPIATPVLVKITEETTYVVDPNNKNFESFCISDVHAKYQFLALGERSYLAFDPAFLGKGEFKIEFNDAGALKTVSLNSDATAGADKVSDLLGTVLPYLAAPKPTVETKAIASEDTAQKTKDKYCIKKSTKVMSVERVEIK
jgi:hypothetical protein